MDNIKNLLEEIGLRMRLQVAFCDKFDEQDKRLYALEENRKLKDRAITSLETRYSEMLMILKDINKKLENR